MESKQFIVRVFGKADSYGYGEVISEGVTLFKAGSYDLTQEELKKYVARTGTK